MLTNDQKQDIRTCLVVSFCAIFHYVQIKERKRLNANFDFVSDYYYNRYIKDIEIILH